MIEMVLILLRRLFRFVITKIPPLLSYRRVCGLRWPGFDHRFPLGRDPQPVDSCLIPDRLAVILRLEARIRGKISSRGLLRE